ncbi:hypothetical protein HUE87_02415 [Candidatus Sulfurimonas marisnigri]|uniref:Lipoprotein n=1 Tax=Candidatus Sulfurimonas marisnigri TaxID=2740405 RepID=A0A7S7M1C5_9BACT|nr:hypothetical protein [Candidatus Sulfurimonas marisnigri]QOY55115.1 hypothetical protein HUE87_02415 [Candidatus Sulfurimonas marisnigri]
MIKFLLLTSTLFLFSACVNKHGISAKYYSDCNEYYDLQGYYHKKCGDDDIVTYKQLEDGAKKAIDFVSGEDEKPKGNVW